MSHPTPEWQARLLEFRAPFTHPAWGTAHSERVYAVARELAGEEPVDAEALFAAAHLHDLGAFPPYRRAGVDHAARAAELAPGWLAAAGFPPGRVALVCEVIRGHMFDAVPGPSREAVLFHDADTLDFLGAVGAVRILAIAGLDDWAPDRRRAVELLGRFARELPGRLLTSQARELGRLRQVELERFLDALARETGGFRDLEDQPAGGHRHA
jgi:uncharacterized protein